MHFSSGINRPPYEAADEFLQITSGCSHGSCRFCTFYKDSPFSLSPMEEIEAAEACGDDFDLEAAVGQVPIGLKCECVVVPRSWMWRIGHIV